MGKRISLIAPNPPRLSALAEGLQAIEASGMFSNYGPVVRRFETDVNAQLFGGRGRSLTVANATLGLMIAMRHVADQRGRGGGLALMPAFTFAATAHAAEWAGLTPLIADSDPDDWAMSPAAEEEALARFGDRIAVIVPYATFANGLDLDRYAWLSERHGVGVVVDAAASLGTLDDTGGGFGAGAPFPVVFSMHATKPFATAEGGLIHSGDLELIEALRRMTNFGFDGGRAAISPAINAKLPEVLGLMAQAKLDGFERIMRHRANLADAYRAQLGPQVTLQKLHGRRQAAQFMPLLLPPELAGERARIIASLDEQGVGAATYFSPHLGEQPHFQKIAIRMATPVADDISARVLSLPLTDHMALADVEQVCAAFRRACAHPVARAGAEPLRVGTLLVGGGPGGIAFLDSATKHDKLVALARAGLAIVERRDTLGAGELPTYAITSDSTAETFLSAAKDNVHPELAALVDAGGGREIGRWVGKLGVPLAQTGPFLQGLGESIGAIVTANGGSVLRRHEVREAHRLASGEWRVLLTDLTTGAAREAIADNIVLATGGYQSESDVAGQAIAGDTIGGLAGDRLMLGDTALRIGGIDAIRERVADKTAPRIAIIGASTSALAATALLLKANPAFAFGAGAITLLHRQPLRPFYHSADAAHADGFTDFGPDDICPVSGFVYRLAGFRLEARELVLRILGVGGRVPDPRLVALQIGEAAETRRVLDQADVVIAALGYRPRALPLFDHVGKRITLSAHAPGRPRMVDQQCRMMDVDGRPIPGAYGIGLAAGFVPQGKLGGEPSFKGKANGLWLWQNDVGQLIVDQLLDALARRAAA